MERLTRAEFRLFLSRRQRAHPLSVCVCACRTWMCCAHRAQVRRNTALLLATAAGHTSLAGQQQLHTHCCWPRLLHTQFFLIAAAACPTDYGCLPASADHSSTAFICRCCWSRLPLLARCWPAADRRCICLLATAGRNCICLLAAGVLLLAATIFACSQLLAMACPQLLGYRCWPRLPLLARNC